MAMCSRRPRRGGAARIIRLVVAAGCCWPGAAAVADDNPVYLQWFETRWGTIEHRMPDFFMAGYDGTWLPPASRASDPTSPGYDVFDRFDLGRPGSPTLYGTEGGLRAAIAEFHRAGAQVFVDSIMNHNSGRTDNPAFLAAGGWPGFVMQMPGDFWGDFHDGSTQSTNPGDPNYNLFEGDLVGLIDIAQEKNYQFIRHPVEEGNPQNIPPGTVRNRPDPANARLYPDDALPGRTFVNPSPRGGNLVFTMHPFNTADGAAGDAAAENATGLLMRWTRWMLEDVGVDGFRLDAAKHIPQWFWDQYWDAAVHEARITPAGTRVTPYSFGEVFGDFGFTASYIRKDSFADRDVLDLSGAGELRNVLNASGFGSWGNVLGTHIDNQDDGFNNGTQGVNHVYSHDNGSAGNGSSNPPVPGPERGALPQHAYVLFRPGPAVVYHNGREFASLASRGFWPREGSPTALGAGDPHLARLVQLSNGYARGFFFPLNGTDGMNPSMDDVLVFERRALVAGQDSGNVVVAVNDRYDAGVQVRSIQVSFAPGTRLHELTGNAADPMVDPSNQVPEVLTVDASRRVLITVPNNVSAAGAHHRGYVVYGPAAPSGMLTIPDATGVLAPDDASVPSHRRRLTPMDVVTTPTFDIALTTTLADPFDGVGDNNAVFRIDGGFADYNGSGGVDIGEGAAVGAGYEEFVTFRRPLMQSPAQGGAYVQRIDTTLLDEGPHYISVLAFRERPAGMDPIFTDLRRVVYVDRLPPQVEFDEPDGPIESLSFDARVAALDRATSAVHILLNVPEGTDPLTLVSASNLATRDDRFDWRRSFFGLPAGLNRLTVVALEPTGRSSVSTHDIFISLGSGDVNRDGVVTIDDLHDGFRLDEYRPEGDLNGDGGVDAADMRLLELRLRQGEVQGMAGGR